MQRHVPLKRTGFKRNANASSSGGHCKPIVRKARMKATRKRVTIAQGSRYLTACRGEPCYLNVRCAHSDYADPTVVPCHDNRLSAGKGMGLKSSHDRTVPGCFLCHAWLDQGSAPNEEKVDAFDAGLARWIPVRSAKLARGRR